MLSVPLNNGDEAIGALNFYSERPGAFGNESRQLAELLARPATAVLLTARAHEATHRLVEALRTALQSRPVIDLAKGILMAQRGCSEDEAFDILRCESQRRNKKLRDLAQDIVDGAAQRCDPLGL